MTALASGLEVQVWGWLNQGAQWIDFLSSYTFIFYLKTEAESSFRNAVILLIYRLDDTQYPKDFFLNFVMHHCQEISDVD